MMNGGSEMSIHESLNGPVTHEIELLLIIYLFYKGLYLLKVSISNV